MTENDLLKRQRETLQKFRRITYDRSEAETRAYAVLDSNKKSADDLLDKVKEKISTKTQQHEKKMHEISLIKKAHNLLIASLIIYLFSFYFFPWPYYYLISQIISSVMLNLAASIWDMKSAVPAEKDEWDYWLFIIPLLPLATILYYILSSYPKGLKAISERYPDALEHGNANIELKNAQEKHIRLLRQAELNCQKTITQARLTYNTYFPKVKGASYSITLESDPMSASWIDGRWKSWVPVKENKLIPLVRIGTITENGKWDYLTMPAFLPVIRGRNVVIKVSGEGKDKGVELVRSIMLRLLTSVPPSKLRFVLIDPVGSGQNVAAFMHLADYDEALTGNKVWTENQDIEEQLTSITKQMEFIIQKFLRDKYSTIEDYNVKAGEIAEPYRVVVVLNFPVNFTISSARLLETISRNGPRCGIYTIITVDMEKMQSVQW